MKHMFFSLCAGAVVCIFVLQFPSTAVAKGPETVLYAFSGNPDGSAPSSLIDVRGELYGTTSFGGTGSGCSSSGCGTVFEVDPATGAEAVLYSFCGENRKKLCEDGEVPGGLIKVRGRLYGETQLGGAYQAGTVFAFDPKTRRETVIHSFCAQQNCTDGSYPDGGLTDVSGTLYGTTPFGGAYDKGAVFALDPATGAETVLYSFCGGGYPCTDGELPGGGLIDVDGTLYGTTGRGGPNCQSSGGCGTLFALDPNTGVESILYSFCSRQNCADGNEPASGLIDLGGTLYGATVQGGAHHNSGTVFALDPATGLETVVYSFCQIMKTVCKDGAGPGGLIAVKGKLYGTTLAGGHAIVACSSGCGTVFEVDPATGAQKVLYSFCSQKICKDGEYPRGLFDVNDTFYGTTSEGGRYGHHCRFGCGTVFALAR
jgi:uncharacterized repeat protein (TIGR03803 family)